MRIKIILLTVLIPSLLASCGGNGSSQLVKELSSHDEEAWRAQAELIKMLPDSLPAILDGAKGNNQMIKSQCRTLLYTMGPESADIVPEMVKLIRKKTSGTDDVSEKYSWASPLASIGPAAVPYLIEALEDDDQWTEQVVLRTLALMNPPPVDQLPLMLEMLKDEESFNLARILKVIEAMGPDAKSAIVPVHEFFTRPSGPNPTHVDDNRYAAAVVLVKIGGVSEDVVAYLDQRYESLERDQEKTEVDAIIAFIEGPEALIERLKSIPRHQASGYIEQFKSPMMQTDKAVQLLISELETDDQMYNYSIVTALRNIGPAASTAVPILIERTMANAGRFSGGECLYALCNIAPEDERVVDVLIEVLNTGDVSAKRAAAGALGGYGALAEKAIPHLEKAIEEDVKQRIGWCGNEEPGFQVKPAAIIAIAWIERALEE